MFGIVMGTLSVIGAVTVVGGLARVAIHRAYHPGGCGHRGHWRGHHGHDGRRRTRRGASERGFSDAGFARAAGEIFKRRLRLYEDQEDIVDHALRDVHGAVSEFTSVMRDSRPELAVAFRGESVDDAALAAIFSRHDEAISRARQDVVSAFKQVHAVMEPEQREKAADWLADARTWRV